MNNIKKILVFGNSENDKMRIIKYICDGFIDNKLVINADNKEQFTDRLINLSLRRVPSKTFYTFNYNGYIFNIYNISGLISGSNWKYYYNDIDGAIIYYTNDIEREYYNKIINNILPENTSYINVKIVNYDSISFDKYTDFYQDMKYVNFYELPYLKLMSLIFNININNNNFIEYDKIINENKLIYNASYIYSTIIRNDPGYN